MSVQRDVSIASASEGVFAATCAAVGTPFGVVEEIGGRALTYGVAAETASALHAKRDSHKLAPTGSVVVPLNIDGMNPAHVEIALKPDEELEVCPPVEVHFEGLTVDVKIQAEKQRNIFQRMVASVGLGGGGATETKRILYPMTGVAKPYKMVALMGASGAGKSTLLNVLSRRNESNGGVVKYNEHLATQEIVRLETAFVQQLDIFMSTLTVREHIEAQFRLRLPSSVSKQEREKKVRALLAQMSLVKCQNNVIGTEGGGAGISGGERKRLNVASELITQPAVVFADEPTTGLDSYMAESVVNVLRLLANRGRTIICTIHQPSSRLFEMFDEVILLAEGRLIYAGDRLGALRWMEDLGFQCPQFINPADFLIKLLSMPEQEELRRKKVKLVEEWAEKWISGGKQFLKDWNVGGRKAFLTRSQSIAERTISASFASTGEKTRRLSQMISGRIDSWDVTKRAEMAVASMERSFSPMASAEMGGGRFVSHGWWRQFAILYSRATAANKRNKLLVHARAGQTLFLSLVFGFLYFNLGWTTSDARSKLGGLYTICMNQGMAGAMTVAATFSADRPTVRREYESGIVNVSAYMSAKIAADAPVQIVFPIIAHTLMYWIMGLNKRFIIYLITMGITLLTANAAMSFGYLSSALAANIEVAMMFTQVLVMPLILFGGFTVKLSDVPVFLSWIQYISFVRYGFWAFATEVFRKNYVTDPETGSVATGWDFIRSFLGIKPSQLALDIIMIVVLILVVRAIAILSMSISFKRAKENS